MSRRRPGDRHLRFAVVRFKCPSGHVVGGVYQRPTGGYVLLDKTLRIGRPVTPADKIRPGCDECEVAGRRLDLQASWPKVNERLAELDANPNRGRVDYVLGG